ncbi:MAG: hypothetical protein GYB64_02245 [Chloroflexi bacterium]|nr:hypothetical protein [Chloroflexota bacterium]
MEQITRTRPFTRTERANLDRMLGQALADSHTAHLLVVERSPALFDEFDVPAHIQGWLSRLPARTLKEIAQAITYHP